MRKEAQLRLRFLYTQNNHDMKEQLYILRRKIKALGNSLCFYICRIFPIKQKKIAVCTFEGKGGFGCNPKYIVEELHRRNKEYEFVWFLNDVSKEFPDYIKKVPNTLWSRAYHLTTSKIWIDNYRKPLGTKKRKGQYYLNTNHFTIGIKCTGLNRGSGFSEMARLVNQNDSDMMDALITDSTWCEKSSPKGMLFDGPYIRTGAPRCDVLHGDRDKYKALFREKHNIPKDAKVLMFAPTFREGAKDGKRFVYSEAWTLDFKRLLNSLEKKFGGEWYICIRVHPQLASTFKEYNNSDIQSRLIDESQADDMYEILAGMDAYITDYSSACFEAGFTRMPVFIYADDIKKYANDRGSLMWNIATDPLDHVTNNKTVMPDFDEVFPFSISEDNDYLEKEILEFDESKYKRRLVGFFEHVELIFEGAGSKRVADALTHWMRE